MWDSDLVILLPWVSHRPCVVEGCPKDVPHGSRCMFAESGYSTYIGRDSVLGR